MGLTKCFVGIMAAIILQETIKEIKNNQMELGMANALFVLARNTSNPSLSGLRENGF